MQKTILIVDDDADLRNYLKKILTANNFIVIEAADGERALEIVEKTPPDLVVLDLRLPKVSGETVCVEIKKNYPHIIVIALTAKSKSKDMVHSLRIGADDYIAKPFVAEELVARIESRLKTVVEKDTTEKIRDPELNKMIFRESIVLLSIRLISVELLFGISLLLAVVLISFLGPYLKIVDLFPLYLIVLVTLFVINLVIAFSIVLKWQFEYVEITEEGIIKHTGIFHKKEQKYACNFVEIMTVDQTFWGTLFNYGTLELYDPALKEQIYLTNIASPKKYSKLIGSIVSKEHGQPIPFIAQPDRLMPNEKTISK